jgi:hypothetical protein
MIEQRLIVAGFVLGLLDHRVKRTRKDSFLHHGKEQDSKVGRT